MLDGTLGPVLGSPMVRFDLQFPAADIERLAARFSYEDDARCLAAGAAARARGNYTLSELREVCRWKTPRSASKIAANSNGAAVTATRQALATSDETARMSALLELKGVGVPTASALLMFAFPDEYPILDVRALESLGVKQRSTYPIAFWLAYLDCCRNLARLHGVHIRTLDKALWQHSKDRSARRRPAAEATSADGLSPTGRAKPTVSAVARRQDNRGGDRYDRAPVSQPEEWPVVIDRIREQIQQYLDQLLAEADKLRKALAALDPRSPATPAPTAPARKRTPAPAAKAAPARRTRQPAARPTGRATSGSTKSAVLEALAGGQAMTASEVATKAGLGRATVSTTLSKLAKSGEVQKAQRGYRLTPTASPAASSPEK
jgi:DNA-binding transcriptional ArsR family regulator